MIIYTIILPSDDVENPTPINFNSKEDAYTYLQKNQSEMNITYPVIVHENTVLECSEIEASNISFRVYISCDSTSLSENTKIVGVCFNGCNFISLGDDEYVDDLYKNNSKLEKYLGKYGVNVYATSEELAISRAKNLLQEYLSS